MVYNCLRLWICVFGAKSKSQKNFNLPKTWKSRKIKISQGGEGATRWSYAISMAAAMPHWIGGDKHSNAQVQHATAVSWLVTDDPIMVVARIPIVATWWQPQSAVGACGLKPQRSRRASALQIGLDGAATTASHRGEMGGMAIGGLGVGSWRSTSDGSMF